MRLREGDLRAETVGDVGELQAAADGVPVCAQGLAGELLESPRLTQAVVDAAVARRRGPAPSHGLILLGVADPGHLQGVEQV